METQSNHRIRFKSFELDLATRELRKNGVKLKLQGQPVEVLTMLLERPGEVVAREDIQRRLWPEDTFVDFEHSLNSTIRRLRAALGDKAENPRYIETLPKLGYRFIACIDVNGSGLMKQATSVNGHSSVQHSDGLLDPDALNQDDQPSTEWLPSTAPQPGYLRQKAWFSVGVISAAAIAIAAWWLLSPRPQPRVTNITQITNDGLPKNFVTDGSRIYFSEQTADGARFYQVSAQGGEPVTMRELEGMVPVDISANGSELLLRRMNDQSLWVSSVVGTAPRPLTGLAASEAKWSPSGTQIAYGVGKEIRIALSDGSDSRTLATADGPTYGLSWYPDGTELVFSVYTEDTASLWEVSTDGSGLHRLFPQWTSYSQWYGSWTPDRRYLVFMASDHAHSFRWDIWAARQGQSPFERFTSTPVRLTTGPLRVNKPTLSPNDKNIFFYGVLDRVELVRYDLSTKQWVQYLPGLSAEQLDFSSDGKSMAYSSYPEHALFRSDADSNHKLQLMAPPQGNFANPRFSPDKTLIAFAGSGPSEPSRVFVEPAEGGEVRKLTNGECGRDGESDPVWSPDSASLVFGCVPEGPKAGLNRDNTVLRILNLKTGEISVLPGSQGLWSPRWSPNGRYLIALSYPLPADVVLYDMQTHLQQRLFAPKNGSWPAWSGDSQYAYVLDGDAEYRVRISDRIVERVAELGGLKGSTWAGIAPDGSVIATRNTGNWEIYALDWEEP